MDKYEDAAYKALGRIPNVELFQGEIVIDFQIGGELYAGVFSTEFVGLVEGDE